MSSKSISNLLLIAVTIVGILLTAFFVTATVYSRTDIDLAEEEAWYREQEQECVKDIRSLLNSRGLENSGVNLTRVVEPDGSRQYSVTVHHKYLDMLSGQELAALLEEIRKEAQGNLKQDDSVTASVF